MKKKIECNIKSSYDKVAPLESYIWRNPQLGLKALALHDGNQMNLKVWMLNCTEKQFHKALLTAAMFAWYQVTKEKDYYDPHMGFTNSIEDLK